MSELLVSLKARRDAARGFELNTNIQIEVYLLDAQIKAVETYEKLKQMENRREG